METGMMWFDGDKKKGLQLKIDEAARYMQRKYGLKATLCMVNPRDLDAEARPEQVIEVRSMREILPGHLWIGVEVLAPPSILVGIKGMEVK